MSLSSINGKLYLFGGSGPSASCFNDLQIFDPKTNCWVQANICDNENVLKPRAGHSATVVNSKLYIVGGSCGSLYYKDYFVLDTDPAPEIKWFVESGASNNKLRNNLKDLLNREEFSDI